MRLSQEGCTLGFVLASGGWRHWQWKRDGMGGCEDYDPIARLKSRLIDVPNEVGLFTRRNSHQMSKEQIDNKLVNAYCSQCCCKC